jgi:hypothetical protein
MTTKPKFKHPRGHCWNAVKHAPDFAKSVSRLETPAQCRAWLAKLNEMGESARKKELVSQRYQELQG